MNAERDAKMRKSTCYINYTHSEFWHVKNCDDWTGVANNAREGKERSRAVGSGEREATCVK